MSEYDEFPSSGIEVECDPRPCTVIVLSGAEMRRETARLWRKAIMSGRMKAAGIVGVIDGDAPDGEGIYDE